MAYLSDRKLFLNLPCLTRDMSYIDNRVIAFSSFLKIYKNLLTGRPRGPTGPTGPGPPDGPIGPGFPGIPGSPLKKIEKTIII